MSTTTRTPSRTVPALLAAVVVSIVLGIIGMHALSTHGVIGATDHFAVTSPVTSPVTTPMTSPMTGAHGDMSSTADSGDGHDMGSMVMLCFAMLATTAGALLFLGLHRTPRVRADRPTAPTIVTRWVTARLGTGPPYVWNFSVIRC